MDILGPFKPGCYQKKFIIVAFDYFTKWIEAEALSSITETRVQKFIWKNIITRFGLPRVLVFDKGS